MSNLNHIDTLVFDKSVANINQSVNCALAMSLASCWELPGLASVLAEVEEPRQYKVVALGDWAYVYSREGVTTVNTNYVFI